MNTERPHDIIDEIDLDQLPQKLKDQYMKIPFNSGILLNRLASLPDRERFDRIRLERAQAKRDRKAKRKL